MSALFTALVEGETKESLANMVCEMRGALRLVVKEPCAGLLSKGTQEAVVAALEWQPSPPSSRKRP